MERMYELMKHNNPEYAVKKRYTMAPLEVTRVGTTKTCWTNFAVNCNQMNRQPDHVLAYFQVRVLRVVSVLRVVRACCGPSDFKLLFWLFCTGSALHRGID